jgi:MFS family permease
VNFIKRGICAQYGALSPFFNLKGCPMLASNIWKNALFLVFNKRIFVAILSVYYMTVPNVDIQTVGLIIFLGNIAGFLFEIPSGYLSDKMGHKNALVLSRVLMTLSTLSFLLANSLAWMIVGSVLLSLSIALVSGTGSAFMHDTLQALGREKEYTKIMGRNRSIGFAVPIVLMVLTPFLVSISYKLPFLIALVMDLLAIIVTLSYVSPPVKPHEIEEIKTTNFKDVIRQGLQTGFFHWGLLFSFVGGITFALSVIRAPYQEVVGIKVIYFGVLFGVGRAVASLMLFYSGKMSFFTLKSYAQFKIITYAILLGILGITENMYVVAGVFIVLNAIKWGMSQISNGLMIDLIKHSKFKATLFSVKAQVSQIISAVVTLCLGWGIAMTSYPTAFFTLGLVLLVGSYAVLAFVNGRVKST